VVNPGPFSLLYLSNSSRCMRLKAPCHRPKNEVHQTCVCIGLQKSWVVPSSWEFIIWTLLLVTTPIWCVVAVTKSYLCQLVIDFWHIFSLELSSLAWVNP
jgi:hypothetical protein